MRDVQKSIKPSKYNQFPAEYDDVYAAIACAVRNSRHPVSGEARVLVNRGITKRRIAAIHQKMLAGEPLEQGQEQEIASRLQRQLGAIDDG